MNKLMDLLVLLSDGRFHSGEILGKQLGVTRTSVWKLIQKAAGDYGIEFHKIRGRGYAIADGLELLNDNAIKQNLTPIAKKAIHHIEILPKVDSTNNYLLKTPHHLGDVCFAEYQFGGRGRRGRVWDSPFGRHVYMSLLWSFTKDFTALQGLTLAIAVAVARALLRYGLEAVQLKWPNDVYYDYKKLAGILVEMKGVAHIDTQAVIGVGLNVHKTHYNDTLHFMNVATILKNKPSRNQLAALLLNELTAVLVEFDRLGFAAFAAEWQALDMLYNKPVSLFKGDETIDGIAKGIHHDGALKIDVGGKIFHFHSGEVTLRW